VVNEYELAYTVIKILYSAVVLHCCLIPMFLNITVSYTFYLNILATFLSKSITVPISVKKIQFSLQRVVPDQTNRRLNFIPAKSEVN